jgi:hypothetical protein
MKMKTTITKQFNGLRALFSVLAVIMVLTMVNINSAYAQNAEPNPSPEASPSPSSDPTPPKRVRKHKDKDLEDLRSKITDVFETVEDASNTIAPNDVNGKKRMKEAKAKLAAFTLDDLDQLRDGIDPAELDADLEDAKGKLAKAKPGMQAAYAEFYSESGKVGRDTYSSGDLSSLSSLPGIEDPNPICRTLIGMGRAAPHVLIAAKAVLLVAKIINIAADRGCKQVVVAGVIVLGAGGVGGGNSSLVCIATDAILEAAEQLHSVVMDCNADFTRRSVDTAVARLETIHSDMANSVANDNTNATNITGTVDTAKTFIDGKATTNKDTIVGAIGSGTTTITTAVGDGTSTIVKNDNTNKDAVVANDDANKIEMLRLHIAVDLSSAENSVVNGAFMLPAAKGGYLELVRTVLVQAINNLAGSSTSQANSLLAQGDASANAGDYKNAYSFYRRAYKVAIR